MDQTVNVTMAFQADTSAAVKAINSLSTSLQQIGYGAKPAEIVDVAQFEQASSAARELSYHLKNALNTDTGKLDLTKLNTSLASSNTKLSTLTSELTKAGSTGRAAFVNLATSIANADASVLSLNNKLKSFIGTMANTISWQISSSLVHGFIGAIQSSIGYVQDLNESLNNIRIVTGYDTDQMASFAQQANEAAKALSTTTTAYTDAALIFYQQGLDGKDVTDRADIVVKMANVTGDTAETVSDQMTAVWNNFYDGSQSLEHYADAMTALGAATASSTDEIATGLEKFAAVADTVGLSYDHAAAALATVTATTRQSADVVGTAFKTIFARVESLKLGETLDDGTTLGQYSEALAKIGVNIKDASGELKDMDVILDETGQKWQSLSRDQQVALAQQVAGVRQYSQFIALMDNYDFYQENIETAENSTGELQKQADIYAESWDAAKDRVTASAEEIYSSLINEDFFIGFDNFLSHVLSGIADFVKSIGGVKGVLVSAFSILGTVLGDKIGPAFEKLKVNLQIVTGHADKAFKSMTNAMRTSIDDQLANNSSAYTESQKVQLKMSNELMVAKEKLVTVDSKLSAADKLRAQLDIQGMESTIARATAAAEKEEALRAKIDATKAAYQSEFEVAQETYNNLSNELFSGGTDTNVFDQYLGYQLEANGGSTSEFSNNLMKVFTDFRTAASEAFSTSKGEADAFATELKSKFQQVGASIKDTFKNATIDDSNFEQARQAVIALGQSCKGSVANSAELVSCLNDLRRAEGPEQVKASIEKLAEFFETSAEASNNFGDVLKSLGANSKQIDKITQAYQKLAEAKKRAENADSQIEVKQATEEADKLKAEIEDLMGSIQDTNDNLELNVSVGGLETLTAAASAAGSVSMMLSGLKSVVDSFSASSDATFGERLTSGLMGISMAVPGATMAIKNMETAMTGLGLATWSSVKASTAAAAAKQLEAQQSVLVTAQVLAHGTAEDILAGSCEFVSGEVAYTQAELEALAAQESKNIILNKLQTNEVFNHMDATAKDALATELAKNATLEEAAATVLESEATFDDATMKTLLALKNGEATVSFKTLAAAEWTALGPLALIAAGIIALVAAYKIFDACTVSAEEHLENTIQATEDMSEVTQELKDTIDSVESAFGEYETALEALEACTKGTSDWKDALAEVQEKISAILEAAPELLQIEGMFNEDGTLNSDKYNEWLESQKETSDFMDRATTYGQPMAETQAELDTVVGDVATAVRTTLDTLGTSTRTETKIDDDGNYVENIIDQVTPLTEAVNKFYDSVLNGERKFANEEDAERQFADFLESEGFAENEYGDFSTIYDELNNSLNFTEVSGLVTQLNNTIDNAANMVVAAILGEEAPEGSVEGQKYADAYDEAYKDAKDKSEGYTRNDEDTAFGSGGLIEEYLKAHFGTDDIQVSDITGENVEKSGQNRRYTFTYQGEDFDLSPEQIAGEIGEAAGEAAILSTHDILTQIKSGAGEVGQSSVDAIAGAFDAVSGVNYNDIVAGFTDAQLDQQFSGLPELNEETDIDENGLFTSESEVGQSLASAFGLTIDQLNQLLSLIGQSGTDFYNGVVGAAEEISADTSEAETDLKQQGIDTSSMTQSEKQDLYQSKSQAKDQVEEYGLRGNDIDTLAKANATNIDGLQQFYDGLEDIDLNALGAGDAVRELAEACGLSGTAIEYFAGQVDDLPSIVNPAEIISSMKAARAEWKDVVDGLETGDTISDEDYAKLGEAAQDFFIQTDDGMWQLIGDAEVLADTLNQADQDTLRANLEEMQGQVFEATDGEVDANGLNARTQSVAAYDSDTLMSGAERVAGTDWFQALAAVQDVDLSKYADDAEAYAQKVQEVCQAYVDLQDQLVATADSLGEAQALYQETGDAEAYIDTLQKLASEYDNCQDDLQAYQHALTTGDKEAADAAQDNLELAETAGELGEQYDINADSIEDLADSYKKQGKFAQASGKELAELAKDQIRFDKAVSNSNDNLENWNDLLDGSLDSYDDVEDAYSTMAEAYGDLLDIDGSQLSRDFLNNADNLELMQKALQGDEEAYKSLQAAAGKEILAKVGVDTSQYESDLSYIESLAANAEGQGLADLEAGASLDNQAFLDALSDMVTAAGMTVDQATDYLSSLGIDAEVVPETETDTDVVATNLTPKTTLKPVTYTVPASDGESDPVQATAKIPVVTYTETPVYGEKSTTAVGLKVVSANKSSGGSVKAGGSSTKNTGGSGSGSGGSGGSGGGSGSSSNPSKAMSHTKKTDVVDRYKRIEDELADISSEMSLQERLSDKLYGSAKVASMKTEIELLQKQAEAYRQKRIEAENYLNIDKSNLQNAAADLGIKFTFDEDGDIANYEEAMTQVYNKLYSMETTYNSFSTEDEQSEYQEDYLDPYNEKLELLKDMISQYDETKDLIVEIDDTLAELEDTELETLLESISYGVETSIENLDNELDYLDYLFEKIEDDAYSTAQAIAYLGDKTATLIEQSKVYEEGIDEILGATGYTLDQIMSMSASDLVGLNLTTTQIENLQDYASGLKDVSEELDEIKEQMINDVLMEAFDNFNEKISNQIDNLDYYDSILESYTNITELLGSRLGSAGKELTKSLRQASIDNDAKQIKNAQTVLKKYKSEYDQISQKYQQALIDNNTKDMEIYYEALQTIEDEIENSTETIYEYWESILDRLTEQLEEDVESAAEAFEDAISGVYGTLDYFQDAYDRQKEINDEYLQDYEKLYELSKLTRDINASIDDTDNLRSKQELKKLLKEINALQASGVALSEYDAEVLAKRYELLQAKLKLEEAQNSTGMLRMVKNSNTGHWSYVYTADEDEVAAAEQEYEDKLKAYQELNDGYIQDLQDSINSLSSDYKEKLQDVITDTTLTEAEKEAQIAILMADFNEQAEYYTQQLDAALKNQQSTYDLMVETYQADGADLLDTFEQTTLGILNQCSSGEEYINTIRSALNAFVDDIQEANKNYADGVDAANKQAGTSTETYVEDTQTAINEIADASDEAGDAIKDLAKDMDIAFSSTLDEITEWEEEYGNSLDNIISKYDAIIERINAISNALMGQDALEITEVDSSISNPASAESPDLELAVEDLQVNNKELSTLMEMISTYDETKSLIDAIENEAASMDYYVTHQKQELEIENLISNLSKQIISYWQGTVSAMPEANEASALSSLLNNGSETLEQQVTITAEFPNVTEHNEIEEAFNNIINKASQYANRKNNY